VRPQAPVTHHHVAIPDSRSTAMDQAHNAAAAIESMLRGRHRRGDVRSRKHYHTSGERTYRTFSATGASAGGCRKNGYELESD